MLIYAYIYLYVYILCIFKHLEHIREFGLLGLFCGLLNYLYDSNILKLLASVVVHNYNLSTWEAEPGES
jgi:hypothetical protein